ncbi:zinc finger protein 224-like isoform X2 [Neocloeon triangulifer]|uniref:zinc finger protein 224-like isoform X2 n=1 Tax=Neocloeon triangulifer TaxID=2078957 RepID=UPI00286EE9DE|nr:zinc finger protein 224-like isoform X2 [Neocloeon triangulifer]
MEIVLDPPEKAHAEPIGRTNDKTVKLEIKSEEILSPQPATSSKEVKTLQRFSGPVVSVPIRPVPRLCLKNFTCEICKKGVGTKGGLKYHIQAHLSGRPFKCEICKRSYATKNDFDTHNKRHLGKNVSCDFCNKTFPVKSYLADHITFTHLPKEFVCQICKRPISFHRKCQLEKHLNYMHSFENMLRCKLCSRTFKSKQHYENHCKQREILKYECKKCGKKFPCFKLLLNHLREESRNAECKICKMKVKNLYKHNRRHHIFVNCDLCPFNGKPQDVIFHKAGCGTKEQIEGLGIFCDLCKMHFRSAYDLNLHKRRIHGKFKCPKCPEKFLNKCLLLKHTKDVHTRPYVCVSCPRPKFFSNRNYFDTHFYRHHKFPMKNVIPKTVNKVRFGCERCQKIITKIDTMNGLRNHIIRCYRIRRRQVNS